MAAPTPLARIFAALVLLGLAACTPSMHRFEPLFLDEPQAEGQISVTYLGTSSLLIGDGTDQFMIDGFISRPHLRHPRRRTIRTEEVLVRRVLENIDATQFAAVFVAHSHHDHAMDAPFVAKEAGATLYGSASTLEIAKGGGVPQERRELISAGQVVAVGEFRVTVIEGRHGPMIGLIDTIGDVLKGPLSQPAAFLEYPEGGSFDFLIEHRGRTIFVMAGGGFVPGGLDRHRADVLFLSIGGLGSRSAQYRDDHYRQIVGRLRPKLLVPIHWDNFFAPLRENLAPLPWPVDNVPRSLDSLIRRTGCDGIRLLLLRGFQRLELFPPHAGGDPLPPVPLMRRCAAR